MFTQEKQGRFQHLCCASGERALTPAERAELAALVLEIEEVEALRLRRATERLCARIEAVEAENRVLRTVLEHEARATFAAHLEAFLAEREEGR